MECKFLGMTAFLCVLFLHSCDAGRTPASSTDVQADDLVEDTVWTDTLDAEEELLSLTGETHLDENFMDFLFSFARSRRLQRERICFPLPRIGAAGDTVMLSQTEWNPDFSWMEQDYYTILYNSVEQIEEVKDSTPSQVQVEIYGDTDDGAWWNRRTSSSSSPSCPIFWSSTVISARTAFSRCLLSNSRSTSATWTQRTR